MKRLNWILVLTLVLAACGETTPMSDEPAEARDACLYCGGKADGMTPEAAVEAGILEVANTASFEVLDHEVPLNVRAAESIYKGRPFATIEALDAAYWVGPAAIESLATYAQENGYVVAAPDLELTTESTAFSGTIEPYEKIVIDIAAELDDTVVIHLRKENGTTWDPALEIHQDGSRIMYSRPEGDADAHLPWHPDALSRGFHFRETDTYRVIVENESEIAGEYEFSLECIGGPCNPAPEAPFVGLRDSALEGAFRASHGADFYTRDYTAARHFMFSTLDNVGGEVECVYTGMKIATGSIPDHTIMNTEHTWPKSKEGPYTDLHHLYPTDSRANGRRSSLPFGEVFSTSWSSGESLEGYDALGRQVFEPRDSHKGNVARAIFYVATTYELDIAESEETVLRTWNTLDPVDETERARNDAIEGFQGSRNHYVDYPEMVERVADF